MDERISNERALVLKTAKSGESFLKLSLLGQEKGVFLCLKRLSQKRSGSETPDLFDTADFVLETSRNSHLQFLRESHPIHQRTQLGRSYSILKYSSDFCLLIATNGPHMDPSMGLFELAEQTLNAFTAKDSGEIIFLKAVYLLLKKEGYPVKESWWPTLPSHLRERAPSIINRPAPLEITPSEKADTHSLIDALLHWMDTETDLRLPS